MGRVFDNGPGDRGSIFGRVIPKTQKMVLDAALLNTQHSNVRIKGKSGTILGMESRSPLHLCEEAIENEAFGLPSTTVANFTYFYIMNICENFLTNFIDIFL